MDTSEFIGLATDVIIQDLFNGQRDHTNMGIQNITKQQRVIHG